MPSKKHFPKREEDPFRRIKNWDDGNSHLSSPPPQAATPPADRPWRGADSTRRSRRDEDRPARPRYPSPGFDFKDYARRAPSPNPLPRRGDFYSPPRQRPAMSPRGRYPSPSPTRSRDPDFFDPERKPRRAYTPSPPPFSRNRDRARDPPSRARYPAPSPPPPYSRRDRDRNRNRNPSPDPDRARASGLRRSKTTTARDPRPSASASQSKPKRTSTSFMLSPRWQKAAAAALQAGGLAALQMRSEPGAWAGAKGARVASAALGAAFTSPGGGGGGGARGKGRDRSMDRDRRSDRDRERDRDRDRERERDRDRDKNRDRRSDRDRDRDRRSDGGRDRDSRRGGGGGGMRRSDLMDFGDALGGFIADRWASRSKK